MEGFGGSGAAAAEDEGGSWSSGSWDRKGKVEMAARRGLVGFRDLWRRAWARPRTTAFAAMDQLAAPVRVRLVRSVRVRVLEEWRWRIELFHLSAPCAKPWGVYVI